MLRYHVEHVGQYRIAGWAIDGTTVPLLLEFFDGENRLGSCLADVDRANLIEKGVSKKGGAFFYSFDRWLSPQQVKRLRVVVARNQHALEIQDASIHLCDETRELAIMQPLGALAQPNIPQFRSAFGGLWTDLSNAHDVVEGKAMTGALTPAESLLVHHWTDFGYVILKKFVPAELLDKVVVDEDVLWSEDARRVWIETYEKGEKVIVPASPKYKQGKVKLLDLYSVSEAARKVALHQSIVRFLSIVFERPPLAFQSLSFLKGTEQPIHQNSAYVKVSSPMEFAATWVALEDIVPGTGELQYYPGSHQFQDFLWGKKDKWLLPEHAEEEHQKFLKSLHVQADQLSLEMKTFLPEKGNVLVWSADLAHGGSRIEKEHSRRSLVTHYCPLNCNPFYFYTTRHGDKLAEGNGYYCFEMPG